MANKIIYLLICRVNNHCKKNQKIKSRHIQHKILLWISLIFVLNQKDLIFRLLYKDIINHINQDQYQKKIKIITATKNFRLNNRMLKNIAFKMFLVKMSCFKVRPKINK